MLFFLFTNIAKWLFKGVTLFLCYGLRYIVEYAEQYIKYFNIPIHTLIQVHVIYVKFEYRLRRLVHQFNWVNLW
jgi:hypothetical protein